MFRRIVNFALLFLFVLFVHRGYCLNLDSIKIDFLEGDYKSVIQEGEKLLSKASKTEDSEELYYILALSYLKDGNYLRASDIFEIILKEFKNCKFQEEANLGLADTYFLREDFATAEKYYKEILENYPKSKLKPQVYLRLSQVGFKKGDTQEGEEYLARSKREFPLALESKASENYTFLSVPSSNIYYTVQVGAFPRIESAQSLKDKLTQKTYPAYIEEITSGGQTFYRVRVGKTTTRQEALKLEERLTQEGYPTKIYP